jgi:hypothetical protein
MLSRMMRSPDRRVRDLVHREKECCAFLSFRLIELRDEIQLTISLPLEARDAADVLFAPFLAGTVDAAAEGASTSKHDVVKSPEPSGRSTGCDCEPNSARATSTEASQAPKPTGNRVGTAAMTTAGVAVACGVCCVLPFAFPAVALTAFGSVLATFAGVYWWALSVAVGVVGAGWLWVGLQSLRTGRRAASSTLRAMALATLFLGAAVSWLFAESHIIAMLKP